MGRRFALIIGNSQYQDVRLAQLVTPQEDVNDLASVFRAPDIGGFDDVRTLVDESDATTRLTIEDFFADKKPDDLLVIYFSGHGVRDEQGRLYLAVNNTRANRLRATAVSSEFITGEMDRSRSRRQILILDCCHSGAFAQGSKAVTGESAGTGSAFAGSGYGRVVLTATDSTQYAWEGDKVVGHADKSVFTHYLVEGLRTGDADTAGDGEITVDELYDYVYEKVVNLTPKQTPSKWSYKQQGEIVIARNPNPRPIPQVKPAAPAIPDRPRPFWGIGRVAVIVLLLLGLLGPWVRSCTPTAQPVKEGEPPPAPTFSTTSGFELMGQLATTGGTYESLLQMLAWIPTRLLPLTLAGLIIVTSLRLIMRLLRRSPALAGAERITTGMALLGMLVGALAVGIDGLLWGFWVTSAGVALAVLNLVGESIAARKRQHIRRQQSPPPLTKLPP
jgi:uncharacterized caspase-like protein